MNITTRRRLEAIEQKSRSTRDFSRDANTVRVTNCLIEYVREGAAVDPDDVPAILKIFNAKTFDEAAERCRETMARLDAEYL